MTEPRPGARRAEALVRRLGLGYDHVLGARFAINVFIAAIVVVQTMSYFGNDRPIWAIAAMVASSEPEPKEARRLFRSRVINVLVGCGLAGLAIMIAGALVCLAAFVAVAPGCSTIQERVHLSKGTKLYKAQKYEAAIGEFQQILKFKPDSWYANYMISVSYLALYHPGSTHEKDLEFAGKAVASFQKLLALPAPDAATLGKVRRFYINLLVQSDRLDQAVAFYEDLVRKEPNNLEYLAEIAQLYAKKNDFPKAMEYYQKRADADPTNKDAWYTIGVICWERSYRQGALISHAERGRIFPEGRDGQLAGRRS